MGANYVSPIDVNNVYLMIVHVCERAHVSVYMLVHVYLIVLLSVHNITPNIILLLLVC